MEQARQCVLGCLLHDLGNIVKFDLDKPIMPIANLSYWREVQAKTWGKYGREAHAATYAMLDELGLQEYVGYLKDEAKMYIADLTSVDFANASKPAIMVLYADLRVVPKGVVSLQERVDDLIARYGGDRGESRWGRELEIYVQSLTTIDVTQITERDVEPLFEELGSIKIRVISTKRNQSTVLI